MTDIQELLVEILGKNINHYYIVADKNNQEFILLYVGKDLYTLIDKSKIDYLKEK